MTLLSLLPKFTGVNALLSFTISALPTLEILDLAVEELLVVFLLYVVNKSADVNNNNVNPPTLPLLTHAHPPSFHPRGAFYYVALNKKSFPILRRKPKDDRSCGLIPPRGSPIEIVLQCLARNASVAMGIIELIHRESGSRSPGTSV